MRRLGTALACLVAAVTASGSRPVQHPWPPGVQPASNDSSPRSPRQEMETFSMPPGFHVELVASEPLVVDPVVIDWDPDGRLWVVEMAGYMPEINPSNEREREPTGRIVVLEDTDGDGRMDKRTVFADGLVLPRALKVLDRGVLVAEPPHLWLMRDTNGDLKADAKEAVASDYGRLDGNIEHNDNSLTWALDNWMHTSESAVSLRLKDGKFEEHRTLPRGQWGNSQDDAGHVYRNSNEQVLFVDQVPTEYYARNPNLLRTRGSYESLQGDTYENNTVWPVHPTPGVNRGYESGILRQDGSLAAYTSVSAPTVYRGDRLPAELRGNAFVTEPAANVVSRLVLGDDGTRITARKAYDKGEFLASTDERFRPVYLSSAPDGTLYVVDFYHGIIEHKAFITEYLRDQILSRNLDKDLHRGRIWRVVHDTTVRGPKPALSQATPSQLVAALSHPNGWWRDTAQRLLVERGAKPVAAELAQLAASAPDARTKLHALWALDGNDLTTPAVVIRALGDPSRDVRVSAIRLAERFLPNDRAMQSAVSALIDDNDWNVQQQLAASLAALPDGVRETTMTALLAKRGDDPIVVDAALSGMRGREAALLNELLRGDSQSAAREQAVTMAAATIVRSAQDTAAQKMLAWVADESHPSWARSAVLRGAEVALTGAGVPGMRGRRGVAAGDTVSASCPTCPGARGGPGGASAFGSNRAAPGATGGAGGGFSRGAGPGAGPGAGRGPGGRFGGGGQILRLNSEPSAFIELAAGGGEFGARATAALSRIEWPGKPGMAAPVAPLTAEEQARFDRGREVYLNLCQACHQADGRGQDRVAATLVASPLTLAPPPVTARILLNGKDGPIGQMPPLGAGLSDDQIANVLTYIRREWGNTGTAVDAQTIKDTRAIVAGRTRPWTNDELTALVAGGRGGQQ